MPSIAQQEITLSESRKKNLKMMLDYRYRGGFYSFERLFLKTVEYPEIATNNCVTGILIVAFEVDCEGEIQEIKIQNPLQFGIEKQITNFFDQTIGEWNTCDDNRYTRFSVPIQFRITDLETNTTDALLVIEDKIVGVPCEPDAYYLNKAKKQLEKGKGKKALENINVLIKRNPYNTEYADMKKEAIALMK
jgi:hypothetical protein